ncbi:hypothetical protein CFC21_036117, partial [Triticum aestivum]
GAGGAAGVVGGGGGAGAGGDGGEVRPAGAVLLHLRRLAGGQRQQQLHRVPGARQLPALRHRLRRRPVGALHQRPHHRGRHRSTSGLRQFHPSLRRDGRRPAPQRRQLRLRRRRDPCRDRPAAGRADPVRGAGAELPDGGADAGEHPGRPGHGVGAAEPVHLHGGHGQQRLPQQLLPAGLLQHRQPLHAGAVRRLAHRRLPPLPPGHVQLRRPEGGPDRGGPGRLRPQRAGALQPRRRHLRRPHRRRHPDLQPAAGRLVDQMNTLPGAHFTYINAYNIFADILANAAAYGFTESTAGCCGVGRNNGEVTCLPYQAPCANRDQHIFWDAFHPSEAANIIVGRRSYRAQSPNDAYPMDISTLASL